MGTGVAYLTGKPCQCGITVTEICKSCGNGGVDIMGNPCQCGRGKTCKNCGNSGVDPFSFTGEPCGCRKQFQEYKDQAGESSTPTKKTFFGSVWSGIKSW